MINIREIDKILETETAKSMFCEMYGTTDAAVRYQKIAREFLKKFPEHESVGVYSAPGRTEIGGNHTDHEWGCVVCASIDKDAVGIGAANGTGTIHIVSEGYGTACVDLNRLEPDKEEYGTVGALARGIAARTQALGYNIGGFDLCVSSDVLSGSGLSSSAAFEVLIGVAVNDLFNSGKIPAEEIAKISQYAENIYFGKPCGLQDQMASAVGGILSIDFANVEAPRVEKLPFAFEDYALCIIDSGADHAGLTDEYAAITREMESIAHFFGKQKLREVDEDAFYAHTQELRKLCGDRSYLRACHFFTENARAQAEAEALKRGNATEFLRLVNESGISSFLYLQNIYPSGAIAHQEVAAVLAVCEKLLRGRGARRVHGGGFAGTAQAFVPIEDAGEFKEKCEAMFQRGCCHITRIRPFGGKALF